ncbi:MAG TPA: c-type cytochrome [Candidatus Acidoferrales bacterium]|nr:c-type cytochrome [Candidatus Acidoferrales bacterium]
MEFATRVAMEKMIALMRSFTAPAMIAATATLLLAVSLGAQSEQTPAKEKTAAETYKNIQVLKDVPASQLLPGMRYITTALGVKCDYCHVNPWQSDQKETKQTARRMMTMLFAINKDNFEDRTEVTCYTCHQGNHQPVAVPRLPEGAVPADFIRTNQPAAAPGQPAATSAPARVKPPSADEVLAKFAHALGGDDALARITSRVILADQENSGKTFPQEVDQKAPGKVYDATTLPNGTGIGGFDGMRAWLQSNEGTGDADEVNAIILRREAEINPVAALRGYTGSRVIGQAKIGDEMTWLMRAKAPDGLFEFLYFDEQSGLLVRRNVRQQTIFGALPVEIDYADYRPVDGVAVPFKTMWFTAGGTFSYVVKDVKDNVPIDDSKFAPPEKKP